MEKELSGVIALIPTPFTEEGKIDREGIRSEIDYAMKNGCFSAGVLAGIGEGYLMSSGDWTTVAKTAVDHINGKAPLIVGIASMGTAHAIELVKQAQDLGADAVLAFNPQGMGPYKPEGIYRHYKAIIEAAEIQVVPYAREADPIPFDVIKKLVEDDAITYHKYAFRDCEMLQKLERELGDKLFKFCGADPWTLRFLLLGCKGIMTAHAAVFPKENVELLNLVEKRKIAEARKYYFEKFLVWNDAGFYQNWQVAHKRALKLMGVIKSDASPPLQAPLAQYQGQEIEALLGYLGKI